jgi:ABC-type transporter MlaC component
MQSHGLIPIQKSPRKGIEQHVECLVSNSKKNAAAVKESVSVLASFLERETDPVVSENAVLVSFLLNFLKNIKPCLDINEQEQYNLTLENISNVAILAAGISAKTKVNCFTL